MPKSRRAIKTAGSGKIGDRVPQVIRATRLSLWLPPALLFAFALLLLVGATDAAGRAFAACFAGATGYWLVRTRQARVELTDHGLVVRGQFRTSRMAWPDIRRAGALPMRTRSPLRSRFPYVALTVELTDGRVRQFEEIAAAESARGSIDVVVSAINSRL